MPTVLLVDDEPENVKSLTRYLSGKNPTWVLLTASDETSAGRLLESVSVDLVITDLVMRTDHGGMHVLETAKARDPLLMVILITAYDTKLDRYKAFELGAFDCVQKNVPGLMAAEEIHVKAQAALKFRDLARAEVEAGRRMDYLRRYFDPRVFERIEQRPDVLKLQERLITVAFWDVRGFSHACEVLRAHPDLIAGFLRDYSKLAAEVIFNHGGVLDKYIGDGVMALFGCLEATTDDGQAAAAAAVAAAVEMNRRMAPVLTTWTSQWAKAAPQEVDIGLGCAIHTGDALVGNVGTDLRDQFTALGSNVNIAARIENKSAKGQIVISATTHARVHERFAMKELPPLSGLKNIPGSFKVYEIIQP